MNPQQHSEALAPTDNLFGAADVAEIIREKGWIAQPGSSEQLAWCERAASYLSGHATDREKLAELLGLIFSYDAHAILARVESHAVLSKTAARDVLRQLALFLLDGEPLNSDLFKKIVNALKKQFHFSGRELFQPLRLALAGRAGEGELDRVILLLDEAARLDFAVPVKAARERILGFCAALD